MEDLFYRFIERLRQDPSAFSRNRNFHTFEDDPRFLNARRVHRRLVSLERNLAAADPESIALEAIQSGYKLSFSHAETKSRHVAFITEQEHKLLLSNPKTSERIEKRVERKE
jgi:hypothetical protein